MFDNTEIIYAYTLEEAIADGVLVEIFKKDWQLLTGGKPVVATAAIIADIPEISLKLLWNQFVQERAKQRARGEVPSLSTTYNGEKVWVLEDGQAVTYLYPHEY